MMRKKHLIQTNDLNKTKEVMETPRAKVTVQYIREQQLIQKSPNTLNTQTHIMHHDESSPQDELEIETVEYLEDNQNVEEYIEDRSDKDDFEDHFYPNAIHCLLDLYNSRYDKITTGEDLEAGNKVAQIWRDIAKDMQESLFEFHEREIQHKYALLREQYFAVQTKEDIENFDYFEQLHDIYKDPSKENIIKGLKPVQNNRIYYKDELLMHPEQLVINEEEHELHNFKSEEIVHKEHEFIDMVEKELQAMEGGEPRTDIKEVNAEEKEISDAKMKEESLQQEQYKNLKRTRQERESTEEPLSRKSKTDNSLQESSNNPSTTLAPSDFSLYHYNEQQERRHREKISLMEKSLQIQERALQQQHLLIQELIKRLPS